MRSEGLKGEGQKGGGLKGRGLKGRGLKGGGLRQLVALGRVAPAVLSRPSLWPTALVMVVRLAPRGWWHRWPPLPVPDQAYWRFRITTAYGGSGDAPPGARDLVEYLEWCRERHRPRRNLR